MRGNPPLILRRALIGLGMSRESLRPVELVDILLLRITTNSANLPPPWRLRMLKNIDPLLGPELIATLRGMGHGEDIAIVDRNYPALSAGPKLIRHDGTDGPRTLNAVLSVLPLDNGPQAVTRMQFKDRPDEILPVMADLMRTVEAHAPGKPVSSLSAAEFKLRAASAVAIIVTAETRTYGNILVRKGTLEV